MKIGVDGGGTKTECILVDAAGAIVARHLAPGCNPSVTGPEQAKVVVTDALATLLAAAKVARTSPGISATHFYVAGAAGFWRELAASLTGFGAITTADDSLPVLELATAGAGSRAGMIFQIFQLGVRHRPAGVLADGFEHVLNRHIVSLELPRHDRPAVQHH